MSNYQMLFLVLLLISFSVMGCKDDEVTTRPNPIATITTVEELSEVLTEIADESDAPGFAISAVENGNIVYQKAFGMADLAKGINYTNSTTQPIASLSKTFVAAAVVKAIEEGHFTLETDINDILPFTLTNPKNPNTVVRVKHLVTHTSGLLDNEEVYQQRYHIVIGESTATQGAQIMTEIGAQQRESIPLEELLRAYYLPEGNLYSNENFAGSEPGQTWNYSNIATSLAAYLVEISAGIPFLDYLAMHVFEPLGMQQTAYDLAALDPDRAAVLYWDKNIPLPVYDNDSYPDGQLRTSNEDLAKFLLDMAKGGKGESTTLFSAEGYALLFRVILPEDILLPQLGENHGVFWFLTGDNVYHSGADPGASTLLAFERSQGSGFLLMSNMDSSTDEHEAAYDIFLGKVSEAINSYLINN